MGEIKIKMPPGIKSNVYLDDIMIYSEGQTGGSVTYMSDKLHHYVEGKDDSRWYPKIRCQNSHSLDEGKRLAGTWSTTVWARFQRNKTRQGPLGKFPAGNKQELDGQARKTDSPKGSQNNSQSRLPETKSTLSNWSWSRRTTTVCLIATTAVALISSHLNNQEVLHARNSKRQYPGRHQYQQYQTFRN